MSVALSFTRWLRCVLIGQNHANHPIQRPERERRAAETLHLANRYRVAVERQLTVARTISGRNSGGRLAGVSP